MKRIKQTIGLILVILACSCSDAKKELTYDEALIKDVMRDLYIAAEALNKLDPARKDSFNRVFRDQIETIHGVDLVLFEEDLEKLENQTERYLTLHKDVRDSLIAIEAVVNSMSYD